MNFAEMMEMLRNPQAMQARVNELRERTLRVVATGSSGGGMVKITLNGGYELLACEIADELIVPGERAMLQDLVRAAFNDASAKLKEAIQAELSAGLEGLPLPPGAFGGLA